MDSICATRRVAKPFDGGLVLSPPETGAGNSRNSSITARRRATHTQGTNHSSAATATATTLQERAAHSQDQEQRPGPQVDERSTHAADDPRGRKGNPL
jgi:putative salt-induced outer membrane protein YdiY